MKRKRRLKKGINSLEEQIEIHEKKKKIAEELGEKELIRYYTKEIEVLKKRKKDRGEKLK